MFYYTIKRHIGGEERAHETDIPPAPDAGVVARIQNIDAWPTPTSKRFRLASPGLKRLVWVR